MSSRPAAATGAFHGTLEARVRRDLRIALVRAGETVGVLEEIGGVGAHAVYAGHRRAQIDRLYR